MAESVLPHNAKAREDWRRVNAHIHQEEQKLKELQLDYNEKVAVVEALKLELRQIRHGTQECEQKHMKFEQATFTGGRKLKELDKLYESLQTDRTMLMQQLAAEQERQKAHEAKLEQARAEFEEELQQQRAYAALLQEFIDAQKTAEPSTCGRGKQQQPDSPAGGVVASM